MKERFVLTHKGMMSVLILTSLIFLGYWLKLNEVNESVILLGWVVTNDIKANLILVIDEMLKKEKG